jgi:primase-polymerase (primpol)-like protein
VSTFLALPAALLPYAGEARWVIWRFEIRKGKTTKPPYQARHPTRHARSNDPATWADFATALAAYQAGKADGIGLCLLNSNLVAFDLDDCRDAHSGALEPGSTRPHQTRQQLRRGHPERLRLAHHRAGQRA